MPLNSYSGYLELILSYCDSSNPGELCYFVIHAKARFQSSYQVSIAKDQLSLKNAQDYIIDQEQNYRRESNS